MRQPAGVAEMRLILLLLRRRLRWVNSRARLRVSRTLPTGKQGRGRAMAAKRILLIDDEREVANMLTLALRSGDYEVEFAHTAEHARTCLNSGRYDLVIVDWRLPDGDGLRSEE